MPNFIASPTDQSQNIDKDMTEKLMEIGGKMKYMTESER